MDSPIGKSLPMVYVDEWKVVHSVTVVALSEHTLFSLSPRIWAGPVTYTTNRLQRKWRCASLGHKAWEGLSASTFVLLGALTPRVRRLPTLLERTYGKATWRERSWHYMEREEAQSSQHPSWAPPAALPCQLKSATWMTSSQTCRRTVQLSPAHFEDVWETI